MKILLLLSLFFSFACTTVPMKNYYKPLKELTFSVEDVSDPLNVNAVKEEYFQGNKEYLLDLYFLIANDALYSGCLEIAHRGFVFLYQNDARPGHREIIAKKFELIKNILRFRAFYFRQEQASLEGFKKLSGLENKCGELSESLE